MKNFGLQYNQTAVGRWEACKVLLGNAGTHNTLVRYFYAALELRFCIERLCFEYLLLLIHPKRGFTRQEIKEYKPSRILATIHREQPLYGKLVEFTNLVAEAENMNMRAVVPNTEWLIEAHGRVGDFLHAQKDDMGDAEINNLIKTVSDIHKELEGYIAHRHLISIESMPPLTREIFDAFSTGKIDSDSTRIRLELTK